MTNTKLKERNVSLENDNECLKKQLSYQDYKIQHEKGFENAYNESHTKEQELQYKIYDLIESHGKLVSKIESEKCEIQKQVEELQQKCWNT